MSFYHYRDIAKIEPGDSNLYLLMGKILLNTGDLEKGLQFVNKCVSLDDENRACMSLRKYIKNLRSKIDDAKTKLIRPSIKAFEEVLGLLESTENEPFADPRFPDMFISFQKDIRRELCIKYSKIKDLDKAKDTCTSTLREAWNKNHVEVSLAYATCLLESEKFEEALGIVNDAIKHDHAEPSLRELMRKINAAIQKSKEVDYYKILSVPRNATKQQISRAYKKLAQKWHPDKHMDDRENAEQKMRDINTAFSVLNDDNKRAQFDRGIDPENPDKSSQYGRGHPFHSDPFAGSGFGSFDDLFRQFHQGGNRGARTGRGEGQRNRYYYDFKYDL